MSFFDKFPYTNFHELNLDWIISQLATVKDSMLKAVESAKNAKISETNAKASEDKAKISETNAKASEDKAKISETNAKASEDKAKISETNAKASEDKAKISETNAKASEDKAKISETNAKASEDKAKISETNAKASEDIAQEAETNASASATKAENIASTLTNWSELDSRLTKETEDRITQDNARAGYANDLFSGIAFTLYSRTEIPLKESETYDTVVGGIGLGTGKTTDNSSFYNRYGVYLNLTDLTEGTHTHTYEIPNFKETLLTPSIPFDSSRMSLYYWGYLLGYTSTPKNTKKVVEVLARDSASLKINSIELVEASSVDKLQVLVNYTVGSNYTNVYETPVRIFIEVIASIYVKS